MANTSAAKHKNPPTITNLSMLYVCFRHEYITVVAASFVDGPRNDVGRTDPKSINLLEQQVIQTDFSASFLARPYTVVERCSLVYPSGENSTKCVDL